MAEANGEQKNKRRHKVRHSLLRCIGPISLADVIPTKEKDNFQKMMFDVKLKVPKPPKAVRIAAQDQPKNAKKAKEPKKKKDKKSKKNQLPPAKEAVGATSSTFMTSSVREKMAEISDIDKNYNLNIVPTGPKYYGTDILKKMAPFTPAKRPDLVSAAIAARHMSTPDLFDNVEQLNQRPAYIEHTSYIERNSDDQVAALGGDFVQEVLQNGAVSPGAFISPAIDPVVSSPNEDDRMNDSVFSHANHIDRSVPPPRMPSLVQSGRRPDLGSAPTATRLELTPDLFDDTEELDQRQFIDDTSFIESNPDNQAAVGGDRLQNAAVSAKSLISPAIDPYDSSIEEDNPIPALVLSHSDPIKRSVTPPKVPPLLQVNDIQEEKPLQAPPSIEVIRLRSGRTINRSFKKNPDGQLGSFDGQSEHSSTVNVSAPAKIDETQKKRGSAASLVDRFEAIAIEKKEEDDEDSSSDEVSEEETLPDEEDSGSYSSSSSQVFMDNQLHPEQLNKALSRLSMLNPIAISRHTIIFDFEREVYKACGQSGPLPWDKAFSKRMIDACKKIGEGCFGEVFRSTNDAGDSVALKVIPIEGDFLVNGEVQKPFGEIFPEISSSVALSELRNRQRNATPNFIDVKAVRCVKGRYPQKLIDAWDEYDAEKKSENDSPVVFKEDQLFIVFEFADGGSDLEHIKLKSVKQAESIVQQLALSLAIAEIELQFEHRDLHHGNVLVKETTETEISYLFDGKRVQVESHGVHVYIIDFTNSRYTDSSMNQPLYTNLANDPALFEGDGEVDYQYDIYRQMRDLNGNEWKTFQPKTNIFWLDYLVDKLVTFKKYARNRKMTTKQAPPFVGLRKDLPRFNSCRELVLEHEFFPLV